MSILEMLGLSSTPTPSSGETDTVRKGETDTVRKIVEQLNQLPDEQARYLASFAYILMRAAGADLWISPEETAVVEKIVMNEGGLSEELALLVVQIARTQGRLLGGTEDYLVTREFERLATREQKMALLECVFAVSAADENITSDEDNVAKQIASELKLSHKDYIAARSLFRDYLSVLKPGKQQ